MPTINPALVPTIAPGDLFSELTTNASVNVRWLVALDPVYYSVLNRPLADIVLRQLIIAKAIDQVEASLGNQVLYPFLVQPKVSYSTTEVDVPINWIWDISISLPENWENVRLAKIKRLSGTNGTETAGDYTGKLRLIFTAQKQNSLTEVAVFYADYEIDSILTYQRVRLIVVETPEESTVIDPQEANTVAGFVTFKTLDQTKLVTQSFYNLVAPPTDGTDLDSDGLFDTPAVYSIVDSAAGTASTAGDFDINPISHGTGILTDSAYNPIPPLSSDPQTWIEAFNYPFDVSANLTAAGSLGITIPTGLFREFCIVAPASDEPTGDSTGLYFPVWVSSLQYVASDTVRFIFSTHNVTDSAPSTEPIEFAKLDLVSTMTSGQSVAIEPIADLFTGASGLKEQHFGKGHVILSSLWDGTATDVQDFFTAMSLVPGSPGEVQFLQASTRLSSFSVSRVPKYIPTIGQSQALAGSTSRLTTPIEPSEDNLYVTESDQGLGNKIDLEASSGVNPHAAIDKYGYSGSLCHRLIYLCVDSNKLPSDSDTGGSEFYDNEILPRLTVLLGRAPVFGDEWFNGSRFLRYTGNVWVG